MNNQVCISPVTLFRALGDDLRLAATLLIHQQGKLCVCELMAAFAAPQPKVSRHLASLREAGVLATERRGQWVYYYLNPHLPDWAMRILDETARNHSALIAQPRDRLQAMADRPALQCS
ncbi:metalloregulator ArsR/SmtB family transcription factor [Marinobacter sp. VGCF2001]|uniref:metalloregulator ArsR/SmtB family transcription factor n=1 Tax=Marinobacter sp. VGCF2001 TaxID=3417189 RepID=UPI003CEA6644